MGIIYDVVSGQLIIPAGNTEVTGLLDLTVNTGNWLLVGDEYRTQINHNFNSSVIPSIQCWDSSGVEVSISKVVQIDNDTIWLFISADPDTREDGLRVRLSRN